MIDLAFSVPIEPCPKGRPRFGRTKTGLPVTFTPERTRRWESDFALVVAMHKPKRLIEGPVVLGLVFVLRRPQKLMSKKAPPGRIRADKRPDLDNLEKAVMDSLKTWWRDDAQVTEKKSSKWYAAKGESPCIEVTLVELTDGRIEEMERTADLVLGGVPFVSTRIVRGKR